MPSPSSIPKTLTTPIILNDYSNQQTIYYTLKPKNVMGCPMIQITFPFRIAEQAGCELSALKVYCFSQLPGHRLQAHEVLRALWYRYGGSVCA